MLQVKINLVHSFKPLLLIFFLVFLFNSLFVFGQDQKAPEFQLLPANQTIERDLSGGQFHKYRIILKTNEFLQIKAEQKGADVVVRLFDPNQKQLLEKDSPNGKGFEKLLFVTEKAGEYEIRISALNEKAPAGKYTLLWTARNATEKDRLQITANNLYDEGFNLLDKPETISKGITKFEEALKLYQQIKDRREEAWTLYHLGVAYDRLFNYTKSREYYEKSLFISREIKDRKRELRSLFGLGNSNLGLTQYDKARDYFEQALLISRELKDQNGEASILNNLAVIYYTQAQYGKAKDYYERTLAISRGAKDRVREVITLSNLGNIYLNFAQFDKARSNYEEALTVYREFKDRVGEAITLMNLGAVYNLSEQNEKSRDYYEQASVIYREIKDRANESLTLTNLGNIYAKLAQYEKARDYYEQAIIVNRGTNNRVAEAAVLMNLGSIHEKLAQYEKAKDYYDRVLVISREVGSASIKVSVYSFLLFLLQKMNNPKLAILYGKQAINVFQEIRGDIKTFDKESQQSFLKSKEPIYRKLADILVSEGRFPEAQAVLDLLKEEEFKQIARRSSEALFTLPYSRAEEDAIKIVDRLAFISRELSDLKSKPKEALSAEETKRLNEIESIEIPAANKALRHATESLSKTAPDVKNALDLKMKDNIQNILPALGKGVVALYTVIGKTSVDENITDKTATNKTNVGWILLVTPEFRKAYPIDTKDLEQTVFKFREALRSPAYDAQPVAQELYKKLFLQTSDKQKTALAADLETYLGKQKDKTLMWSLDGVLRYVPMSALHDGKGYLVEKYRNVVFNTASLGSLKDATKPNWEVVGLGISTEGTVKSSDGRSLRFSALKGSEIELNSLVKEKDAKDTQGIFSGTLKINNDFTKEALFEGARTGAPVMHVSTHFYFNPTQEENSFLLLGNSQKLEMTEFQDYPNLFSNVDFLSLSACDTAIGSASTAAEKTDGKETNGKEVEGFAYVAQTLGAKSVMASLWQVSDVGTKELMLKFYQIRKEQPALPKGEALRQAQLSLLNGTNKTETAEPVTKGVEEHKGLTAGLKPFKKDEKVPFAHPYYWSSFILIGNWR